MGRIFLIIIFLAGCGVEKGGKTGSLPLLPSAETLEKRRLAVDPLGYSTGKFKFAVNIGRGALHADGDGNVISLYSFIYIGDDGLEYRAGALRFLANGTVDSTFTPIKNYEEIFTHFLMSPTAIALSESKELYLVANRRTDKATAVASQGTSVVKFSATGFVDTLFGDGGSVRSSESGYESILLAGSNIYIGGSKIRRLSLAGVADNTFAKVGFVDDIGGQMAVAPDQTLISEFLNRYDPTGEKDLNFIFLGIGARLIGWDNNLNGFLFFKPEDSNVAGSKAQLVLLDTAGKLVESYGKEGVAELSWLTEPKFNTFKIMNGRILGYDGAFSISNNYAVFNTDGTRIDGFGGADSGICSPGSEVSKMLLLPSGNVVIFGGDSEGGGFVEHRGNDCELLPL